MSVRPIINYGDLSEAQLAECIAAGSVAWDIETSGLNWSADRIGTCQLAYWDRVVLIQIDDGRPPRHLSALLGLNKVRKIFHHAAFDLRFMAHQWDADIANVACTKVVSKILWPNAPDGTHRLQALVRKELGHHLSKEEQRSNWLARELTDEQITYAAADVLFLASLLDRLLQRTDQQGLRPLVDESFAYLPTRVRLDLMGVGDVFTY